MTDPVDTNALRTQQWQNVDELVEWATAAADEVDRLRKDKETLLATLRKAANAYVERAAMQDAAAHVATVTVNWSVVAVEIMEQRDRLRSVIENAPHAIGCSWFNTAAGLSCNCWKGDAP